MAIAKVGLPAGIFLRPMLPQDGPALTALAQSTPDSGQIQIAPHFHLDAYKVLMAGNERCHGVVAEDVGQGVIVGAGMVAFGRSVAGRPAALLQGLMVQPAFRRRGIARALAAWRLDLVAQELGPAAFVLATVQKNNAGSLRLAQTWGELLPGLIQVAVVPVRRSQPHLPAGWVIRPVAEHELPQLAEELNNYYQDHALAPCHDAEKLAAALQPEPLAEPWRHYYVLVDKTDNWLAGLGVAASYRLMEMHVQKLPAALRLLNKVVRLVPADGRLRQLGVSRVWHRPGQEQAARLLWEMIRWQWRDEATALTVSFDRRDPLGKLFRLPFWLPRGELHLVARGAKALVADRLIYPNF